MLSTTKEVNRQYKWTNDRARVGQTKKDQLLPDGTPRWIRIYDNQGETFDRYTVVFTGKRGGYYVGMSTRPNNPQGFYQHGEGTPDRPAYSHLGKKIHFSRLPFECRRAIKTEYCELWGIEYTHQERTIESMCNELERNPIDYYWQYDDELSDDQIAMIFDPDDESPLWTIQDDIWEYNMEYTFQLEDETIKETIKNHYSDLIKIHQEEFPEEFESWKNDGFEYDDIIETLSDYDYPYYETLREYVMINLNVKELINHTDVKVNVELSEELECLNDGNRMYYDILSPVLSLLKINPREFAYANDVSNFSEFPNYKYRKNPLVDVKEFANEFFNFSSSFARVVFSVNLDLEHYAANKADYNQGLIIPKGTPVWLLDGYYQGTCSLGECELNQDLRLKPNQYTITLDGQSGWGLDDICGLTNAPWNGKEIEPV